MGCAITDYKGTNASILWKREQLTSNLHV